MRRHQSLIILDVAPAYECAEPDAVIADGDTAQPRQPPQIDQQARGRQAEGENRQQALSPGDHERLGVRREQIDCLATGSWRLVIEGRGRIPQSRRPSASTSAGPSNLVRLSPLLFW